MADAILHAVNCAQFSLHRDAHCVGCLYHFLGNTHILFKGQMGPVKHNRGKACPQALDCLLVAGSMVQMHDNRDRGLVGQPADYIRQMVHLSSLDGPLTDGQNHGAVILFCCSDNGFRYFNIVNIEPRDGGFRLGGNAENLF